ncbi:1,4-dihydroxy-6-naphthoate synthase [Ginsengibacter hankyongi]|uniref:1,4-dihydroxy-6-naphtoate synthase n=1 Tax=Ginsengibacter hankyongi TaxID=2607284 RepID=A0A5J5ILD4_9BACT|nr:1,4-dihydroxy-6-naphthoate synthase [Ginsengibacter hankyongi]KAA9040674.1 1,4-dihydroxy-6-naphthoate synthase [Ginsengibacter hankyongi]
MKYTLGFSPCPNDTFIFDALVNNKIDTGELQFDVRLEDVETLNGFAIKNQLDFTKVSYGVLPLILKNYKVLNSGSALGKGVGPLLISKEKVTFDEVNDCIVALPGENTTAHLLFSQAFPRAKNKIFKRYDEIENFVLDSGNKSLGVIIHENRFTYFDKGLQKVVDLGNFWEEKTGYPIPLGGIVGKRSIDEKILMQVDLLIKQSIEFAFKNYPLITDYVKIHSQEMETNVMKKHIDLYVNNYSIQLGTDGKNAIEKVLNVYNQSGNKEKIMIGENELFVTS